ncbi:legume-like lectin family-domain-containing protein [Mycotypha africana]|uniref:legume-like lectin family-domain-containing protein n=1 Tax=Mycotypha africana TaxID=64632 RepID=UPI002301960A|nr:legume-like lectin family-domain-containing protein [Mycotypha africana]KAI8979795.1 legume-like lectin family-domain-containing protein [Mycotypha africana]
MPYIDDDLQNRWFDFGGDAIINTNQHIRLTQMRQSELGYLWSRLPLMGENFEVEFEFKVSGSSGHLYGDGFAMWLTKQRMTEGPVFGSVDNFEGLGVFFDTYDNERAHRHTFPYVMAMLGDGHTSYNNDLDGRETELAGCEADFRMKSFPTKAKLTYHKGNFLQLELQWRQEDEWEVCFKKHDVNLPRQIYLGFSAHTGEVTDKHDIISVTTRSIRPAIKEAAPPPPKVKKPSKPVSVFSVFLKMILAGGIVGVLFIGYRYLDQKNRMKHF